MFELDRYRLSFGSVAERYERGRPPYADEALRWLAQRLPLRHVLDLAAGTGKLSRQLVALGVDVVAVEPDEEMRAVFARLLPDVPVLDGAAEAIPLAAASVDAITVGQALHWFRMKEAEPEMHRVLRAGGGVAALWNTWNEQDPVLDAVDAIVRDPRPKELEAWRERHDPSLFGPIEERTFFQRRRLTTDALVEWVASTSAVVNAPPDEQARIEAEVRALAGADEVHITISTDVAVFDRV